MLLQLQYKIIININGMLLLSFSFKLFILRPMTPSPKHMFQLAIIFILLIKS